MPTGIQSFFRGCRCLFSRTEWAIRLLRLPKHARSDDFALVLLQIDGLSNLQFNRAMKRGRLPFLKSLSRREGYAAHSHYSGIPSNTPAVQAELFYGVKTAIPAFFYRDSTSGSVMKMYESASAKKVEARLAAQGEGLLSGGSSYCNIFSGGAHEAHFCAANNGWAGLLHAANPFILPFLILCYADIFIRAAFLVILEFFLALYDCVRGTLHGMTFFEEFHFIFARVAMCILMRELVVAGVRIDLARGLPIIHANFVGYDDQSHRRGPSSSFAHWSLKGIDSSIRRIWKEAKHSDRRDYDIWIYSDHGQEKTLSYPLVYGRTLEDAVKKVIDLADDAMTGFSELLVTAMGPVGHIYLPKKIDEKDMRRYASRLVSDANVPLVVVRAGTGKASAWTRRGCFSLPEEAAEVFGAEHPFVEEAAADLVRVAEHPDAGEFVLLGWAFGEKELVTFPIETGAHAGIGTEETSGFAFLPKDAPLEKNGKKYLRPADLRAAAQRFLGKDLLRYYAAPRLTDAPPTSLRVMTYNVHGCLGVDGIRSIDRIARIIARHDPDIVALQELDVLRKRSGGVDQAQQIANKLEMKFYFHPVFCLGDEQYGNAVLSRYPMSVKKMDALPGFYGKNRTEKRGALWVSVHTPGQPIQLINTHLSIWPVERLTQAKALMGPEWMKHPECLGPAILCGDFNASPYTPAYKRIKTFFRDSQLGIPAHRPSRTWSGQYNISRIDHVFLSPEWDVVRVEVPRSNLDRVASDHLSLIVDLKFNVL